MSGASERASGRANSPVTLRVDSSQFLSVVHRRSGFQFMQASEPGRRLSAEKEKKPNEISRRGSFIASSPHNHRKMRKFEILESKFLLRVFQFFLSLIRILSLFVFACRCCRADQFSSCLSLSRKK